MPCHARAAAPTSQALSYLWISDDLLHDAFNRFARVSRTARRYGSNVPGPLEARRRLAKRRMGMVAASVTGTVPLPGYDLSVLLGFRSSKPVDQSWKWEAPDLYGGIQFGPPPPPAPVLSWSLSPGRENVEQVRRDALSEMQSLDPVALSKKSFQSLLDTTSKDETVSIDGIQPLVEFLHSSQDEPQAHNIMRLAQWLNSQSVNEQAVELLDQIVRDKLELEVLDCKDASHYIGHILHKHGKNGLLRISALLDSSSLKNLKDIACFVTRDCLPKASQHGMTELIKAWLQALSDCSCLRGLHHNSSVWSAIYSVLATRLQPSQLAPHLNTLDLPDLSRVLLRVWVPALIATAQQDKTVQRSFRSLRPSSLETRHFEIDAILADFEAEQAQRCEADETYHPLVNLMVVLSRHNLPYDSVFKNIFEILSAPSEIRGKTGTSRRVIKFVMGVRRHREIGIPEPHAADLIGYFLNGDDITQLRVAWHIFMQAPGIPLSQFPRLALKMVDAGAGPREIFQLLQRRGEDSVALEFRPDYRVRLRQEHVDLVHLLAHKWAHQPKTTCRIAYRRVWTCFRYLQDRGAPLTDTMSRAMFHAGTLRYLLEGRRVATEQFRYILSLVRRLEGDAVADELDRSVWMYWNHQVRPQELLERVRRLRLGLPNNDDDTADRPSAAASTRFAKFPWTRRATERTIIEPHAPQELNAFCKRRACADELTTLEIGSSLDELSITKQATLSGAGLAEVSGVTKDLPHDARWTMRKRKEKTTPQSR